MKYPEFRDAEYSTTDIPTRNRTVSNLLNILKCIFLIALFILINFVVSYFFKIILNGVGQGIYLNAISIGASVVTVFSALISVFDLLNSNCMNSYQDDIELLECRYLNEKKIFKWEFLKRNSYHKKNKIKIYNYYISSACYKLYSSDVDKDNLVVVVPALAVDFHDIPCVIQIMRIKQFIPEYLEYLNKKQKEYEKNKSNPKKLQDAPCYYIPLPYHLIALYKKIIIHKILKFFTLICFLFVISAIIISVLWLI